MHHENMRTAGDLGMNAHGEDEAVIVLVAPLKLFLPLAFNVVWINIPLLLGLTLWNRRGAILPILVL